MFVSLLLSFDGVFVSLLLNTQFKNRLGLGLGLGLVKIYASRIWRTLEHRKCPRKYPSRVLRWPKYRGGVKKVIYIIYIIYIYLDEGSKKGRYFEG